MGYRLAALLLIFVLLVPVLFACGEDEEDAYTATPVATLTAATTVTATPTPNKEPVKIGAMTCWSGSCAISGIALAEPVIKLVEWQVKQQGGILGGRDLKVIKYDNRGSVAEAQAGATKLLLDDNVSVIVWGGISPTEFNAVSTYAEENEIPYISFAAIENLADKKFSVNGGIDSNSTVDTIVNFSNKLIKPQKIALLFRDVADIRARSPRLKSGLETYGAEVAFEEYVPSDTVDFMPYLTRIKRLNPDLLVFDYGGSNEGYITIAKQITELGGWGETAVITNYPGAAAVGKPGAEGWYILAVWTPGRSEPGSMKFETDFQTVNGKAPSVNQVYYYNTLWTAIYAIEMAGTDSDRVAIAQALRSGNLQWDTPQGPTRFTIEGLSDLSPFVLHVEGGKMVPIGLPE